MRIDYSRVFTKLGWIIIPILIVSYPVLSNLSDVYLYIPFIISAILLGMPHGAVDHLVPRYLSSYSTIKSIYIVSLLYLIAGGLYTIMWFIYPSIALGIFIILTILHWGQGDTYIVSMVFSADYIKNNKISSGLSIIIRGSLPMLVPFIFHQERYLEIVGEIISLFDNGLGVFTYMESSSSPYIVSGILIVILMIYILASSHSGKEPFYTILKDSSEIGVLVIFFALYPPVLSIGIYFCLWHAARHIGRLLDTDDVIENYDILYGIYRFIIISTPMTVGGILVVGLVWFVTGQPTEINDQLLGVYLVGISVMTLPHFIVVIWMDIKQSVYQTIN